MATLSILKMLLDRGIAVESEFDPGVLALVKEHNAGTPVVPPLGLDRYNRQCDEWRKWKPLEVCGKWNGKGARFRKTRKSS